MTQSAPPPSADEPAPEASGSATAGCSTGTVREALLGVGYREDGAVSNPDGVRIALTSRSMIEDSDPPLTMFSGATEGGMDAELFFALDPTFTVADLVGKTVEFSAYQEVMTDCLVQGGGRISDEPVVLAEKVLRDSEGKLLVLNAPSTPTAADGKMVRSSLAPEIGARWVEIGDPECEARRVALEVTAASGESVTASYDQRADISIDGTTYVLAVANVSKPPDSGYCGYAVWVLYRKDILIPE